MSERPLCLVHSWTYRRGYYFEPVRFQRCRACKAFRWRTLSGSHFERVRATWPHPP